MSMQNIYSNAFNFSSFLSSGVDPRTGQYTATLSLVTLKPFNLEDCSSTIALHFSPFNDVNMGYGQGWEISTTRLDMSRRVLVTHEGKRYRCEMLIPGTEIHFIDKKVRNLRAFMINANTVRLQYKSGITETLQRINPANPQALLTSVTFANGETFDFSYTIVAAGRHGLTEIRHRPSQSQMLRLSYFAGHCNRVQYPDDNGDLLQVDMEYRNNLLTRVSMPYAPNARTEAGFILNYTTLQNNYTCLQEFRTPSGSREIIQHNATGLRVTMSSTLPCVVSTTLHPGNGQPPMSRTWQYSPTTNFTGFSSGRTHIDPEQDNLYLVTGNYTYTSTENLLLNDQVAISITRDYNRFHLLTREETVQDGKRHTKRYRYNEVVGLNYYQQPMNLPLVAEETEIFTNILDGNFRQQTTTWQTDEWGNVQQVVYPDGTLQQNVYFAVNGQSGMCPPDPLGFCRFIRSKSKRPAFGNTRAITTHYSWQTLPSFANSLNVNYICIASEETDNMLIHRYSYINSPVQPLHSLLSRVETVLNNHVTTAAYSYQTGPGTRRTTETITGHDGTRRSNTATHSLFTRHLLEQTDENATITQYRYTSDGKMAEKRVVTGINSSETHRYAYTFPGASTTNSWPVMTETNTFGLCRQYHYDGIGRICRILEQDDDAPVNASDYAGTLREVKSRTYNALGRLISETHTDWLWDLNAATSRRLSLPTRKVKEFVYDGWGNVAITHHNDGRVEIDRHDPVANTSRQGLQGLGIVFTQKNIFGEPESIALLKPNNQIYAITRMTYDGFGRKISETEHSGAVTRYEWDNFDRLTRKTLPDGTHIDKSYAAFTTEQCAVALDVQGSRFASAHYDGLERVTEDQCGGRTQRYHYRGGERLPHTITLPDKQQQTRSYAFHLGSPITHFGVSDISQHFDYHAKSGKLMLAREGELSQHMNYFPSGLLQSERLAVNNVMAPTRTYRHSMGGLIQFKRDSKGKEHRYYYDSVGRLQRSTHDSQEVVYRYDSVSRVSSIETRAGTTTFTTTINYDPFSREISRTFRAGNQTTTLAVGYTPEGKIRERELRSTHLLLLETYHYDSNDRLIHYQCSGAHTPRDHQGRTLTAQRYHYDRWGNIIRLENTHGDTTSAVAYEFSPADPTQLIAIVENGQRTILQYDVNGNLTRDEKGQTLIYDAKNRLQEVRDAANQLLCCYQYDAMDRLIGQQIPGGRANQYFYSGQTLSNADIAGGEITWTDDGATLKLGHVEQADNLETWHQYGLMVDGTPCLSHSENSSTPLSYTPFGHRSLICTTPGLNGAHIDPVTGWYFLGNGYRVFNPVLMRFHSPDSWSPFGAGGINAWIYALNDPINKKDPSGHLSEMAITSIVLGAVGILLSIFTLGAAAPVVAAKSAVLAAVAATSKLAKAGAAISIASNTFTISAAATSESNPEASYALNMTSLALSALGVLTGATAAARGAISNAPNTGVSRGVERIASIAKGHSPVDSALTAFEITGAMAYVGVTVAAEFVDEETAKRLGIAGLVLTGAGIGAGAGGTARTRWPRQGVYEFSPRDTAVRQREIMDINEPGVTIISSRV